MSKRAPTAREILGGRELRDMPRHSRLNLRVQCCRREEGEGLGEIPSLRNELNMAIGVHKALEPYMKQYLADEVLKKDSVVQEMAREQELLGQAIDEARLFFNEKGMEL